MRFAMTCSNRIGGLLLAYETPLSIDVGAIAPISEMDVEPAPRRGLWSALLGQRVRICKGIFRGTEGTLAGRCGAARWVVAVDVAERGVTLEIESDAVQFIEPE